MIRRTAGLCVATYNIHRCVGHDRRYRPDRIAEVLKEIDADVVGLQEVDAGKDALPGENELAYLARIGGYRAVAGPNVQDERARFGNALLTRLDVCAVRRLDLSFAQREKRGLIDVDLDAGGRTLRVVVTHLGLTSLERRVQVRRMLHAIEQDHDPDRPTILLGDFNEWRRRSPVLTMLQQRFGSVPRVASFPARLPMLPLDAIWVLPREALLSVHVHNTQTARRASDHLPVKGRLSFDDAVTG